MRRALLALALVAGCTKHNGNNAGVVCTPGEQRGCACIGGQTGVQICNAMGTGLGECFGCPGGPQLDLAGVDFSGIDFSGVDLTGPMFDFPPGTDLTGFNPDLAGADLAIPVEDMAMSMPDMATFVDMRQPNDMASTDLAGVTPCPTVMLLLDTSGSMGGPFTAEGNTTHIAGAHTALASIVDSYGARVPLGFAHFDAAAACNTGIVTSFEPMAGNQVALKTAINASVEGGSTNTGDAINVIAADGNLHVPGAFIVMVTDGAGNCEATDPGFSVTAVDTAAKSSPSLKTYVIALDVAAMALGDEAQMELMATDGQRPCAGGFCEKHAYYPAPDTAHLTKALDLVMNDIVKTAPGCGGFACFPSGAPCGSNTTCCGTVGCKNLKTDAENCGTCGTVCGGGGTCSNGACHCGGVECPAGDECCQGTCCSLLDMSPAPPPPPCVCNTACILGCDATNCCVEDSTCAATPTLCTCVGTFCT